MNEPHSDLGLSRPEDDRPTAQRRRRLHLGEGPQGQGSRAAKAECSNSTHSPSLEVERALTVGEGELLGYELDHTELAINLAKLVT